MEMIDQAHHLVAATKLFGILHKMFCRIKSSVIARLMRGKIPRRSCRKSIQTDLPSPSEEDLAAYAEIVRKLEERMHAMELERAALHARLAATKDDMRLLVSRSLDVSTVNSLGG